MRDGTSTEKAATDPSVTGKDAKACFFAIMREGSLRSGLQRSFFDDHLWPE